VLCLAHRELLLLLVQPLPQIPHLLLVLARLAYTALVEHPLRILQLLRC